MRSSEENTGEKGGAFRFFLTFRVQEIYRGIGEGSG